MREKVEKTLNSGREAGDRSRAGVQQNLDNCIGESGKKASHGCPGINPRKWIGAGRFLSLEPSTFRGIQAIELKVRMVKLQRAHGGYLGTQRR